MLVLKILAILGILDSSYLTYEHFSNASVYCGAGPSTCNLVLTSKYAQIFGIPLSLLGLVHYLFLFIALVYFSKKLGKYYAVLFSKIGFVFSVYLVSLQLFVIHAICLYCMASAFISTLIFLLILKEGIGTKKTLSFFTGFFYKLIFKKIMFLFDAEDVHDWITNLGEVLGKSKLLKSLFSFFYEISKKGTRKNILFQKIEGIEFRNPIGLSAGFDYNARLTDFLPVLDFGFETVGTITNMPYEGNPKPRLGRLPKSKSLLVNKGFKSIGAIEVSKNLFKKKFSIPVGISIGRTNSAKLKTVKESIKDIVQAFKIFEKANVKNSYYELNISCPNLIYEGNVEFYSPKNLKALVGEVEKLKIKKPIFVKMPIDKTDSEVLSMLRVLSKYNCIRGVIFGNLQKNRKDKSFDKKEIKNAGKGNFSGVPTQKRSNELIRLSYKEFGKRFVIIGCGGVFSAKDAYEKIKKGASLVQLITGLIFEGPQLVSEINQDLEDLLKKDGFSNIQEAIGVSCK